MERVEVTAKGLGWGIVLSCGALAGCGRVSPPKPIPQIAEPAVKARTPPKPAPTVETKIVEKQCPSPSDLKRLRQARPKPLNRQQMPPSPAERVAKIAAQLGLYEAPGGWADQVDKVLRECARE